MRKIDDWLNQYGESHQNPTNKTIHWICVPLIFFSIVGLFWEIKLPIELGFLGGEPLNGAMIALGVVFLYYITLSIPLAIGMFLFDIVCLGGTYALEQTGIAPIWMISVIIFVLAWIGQFIGHNIEGKKPSFFKDIQFLMVGPAWLMSFLFKKAGINY